MSRGNQPRWTSERVKDGIEEVHIRKWNYFIDYIQETFSPGCGWVHRGHRKDYYKLESTIDRKIADKRVFPAIELNKSGTRREELLLPPEILQKTRILRQFMYNMDEIESMELMIKKMKETKTNVEFFEAMRRGG